MIYYALQLKIYQNPLNSFELLEMWNLAIRRSIIPYSTCPAYFMPLSQRIFIEKSDHSEKLNEYISQFNRNFIGDSLFIASFEKVRLHGHRQMPGRAPPPKPSQLTSTETSLQLSAIVVNCDNSNTSMDDAFRGFHTISPIPRDILHLNPQRSSLSFPSLPSQSSSAPQSKMSMSPA